MTRPLVFTLIVLAATACERRQAPDPGMMVQRVLGGTLVYPRSERIDMSAGGDAAQMTLRTADSIRPVADWFRHTLALNGWKLQSDLTGTDGSVTLSATRDQRPVWITLRPNEGAPGTIYTMIGAVVTPDSAVIRDSAKARARLR